MREAAPGASLSGDHFFVLDVSKRLEEPALVEAQVFYSPSRHVFIQLFPPLGVSRASRGDPLRCRPAAPEP
jgi:hypothetical protein